jgi:hypothetical protein
VNIFNWRRPAPKTDLPFGLTADQIRTLDDLTENTGYRIFTRLLQQVAELNGEYLLRCKSTEMMYEQRGFISALRTVITLIPQIVGEVRRRDDERRKQPVAGDGLQRGSFIGGPWNAVWQRLGNGPDSGD